jgi:hypothetical protein
MYALLQKAIMAKCPHRTRAAPEQTKPKKIFVVTEVVFTFWRGLD